MKQNNMIYKFYIRYIVEIKNESIKLDQMLNECKIMD